MLERYEKAYNVQDIKQFVNRVISGDKMICHDELDPRLLNDGVADICSYLKQQW
jgi:hypothetical protein